MEANEKACPMCAGKGYILDEGSKDPCLDCNGTGVVPKYNPANFGSPAYSFREQEFMKEAVSLKIRIQHLKDAISLLLNYQMISFTNKCGDIFLDNHVCKTCEVYQECLGRDLLVKALRQAEVKHE